MLDILEFVFSSFWIWAGTVVLTAIVSQAAWNLLASVLSAIQNR